ncbi:NAD(P)-dependent oxidoreductase [Fulvivirga sedimenti]|uniref:NAD(P)H-binding protein n=1 Tax=Fulvivirga sedimenti TaxID=2879465 RepID=A0A9X1KW46_9BACT|nr:NAD(P)H-binding protein [Fulvivirga sedimenti]MCA6073594.1 NAD(P)H-binding protein [Fulvivirga sedimenti]
MKILVLGGSGRTGQWVIQEALEAGFFVHALVRNQESLPAHDRLRILEGSCLKRKDLDKALTGTSAVVSTLNVSRKSDFTWSKLRSPEDLMSKTIESLIPLMYAHGISRLIAVSASGVGDSSGYLPGWFGWLIKNSNIRYAYADHERQEKLIRNSDLDWTVYRPVGLTNANKISKVKITGNDGPEPSLTISRRTLAHYIIESLENNLHFQESPIISTS